MNTDFFMDTHCFACGKDNDKGLQLEIKSSHEDGVAVGFLVPPWCQGYQDVVHGGIVSTILDEIAVWAAYHAGYKCVTAELTVRIKIPMYVNTSYTGRGKVLKTRHQFVLVYAEIINDCDRVYAYAHLKLMKKS